MDSRHRTTPRLQIASVEGGLRAQPAEAAHAVRFYEAADFLEREVTEFIATGLNADEAVVIVATPEHQRGFDKGLFSRGIDAGAARARGQLVCVDAEAMVARLLVDGRIDAQVFHAQIVSTVNGARSAFGTVRAFGEMVNILWARGQRAAAIKLEGLWTAFIDAQPFVLLCAYDLAGFRTEADRRDFEDVCHAHSHVLPSEWERAPTEDARNRTIALLTQRARALENEIEQRRLLERERTALLDQERRMRLRLDRLQSVTGALSEALTPDDVARVVVGQMSGVVQADQAVLTVPGEHGALVVAETSGSADPSSVPLLDGAGRPGAGLQEAAASLRAVWTDGTLRQRASACIPLILRGRMLGVIAFSFNPPKTFVEDDRALLIDLGRQAAMALERANLYRQAQDAVQRRDTFMTIASHELKTPVTSLQLQVEGLLRLASSEAQLTAAVAKTRLEKVNASVRRLSRLIQELLDVSRIHTPQFQLERQRMNLSDLVRDVAGRFDGEASRQGCELRVSLAPGVVGQWDPDRLDQVITNLVSNAIRYASGKPVIVTVSATDTEAFVSVKDHGEGIALEDQQRIFGQFERGTTVRHGGGLGLGLWVSREIARAHGGGLTVASVPGTGSTFEVALPLGG